MINDIKYYTTDLDDTLDLLREEFNSDFLSIFLSTIGILVDEGISYSGLLSNYIYFSGNKEETYTEEERQFIDKISNIVVFNDFFKKTRNGNMLCRVVAVRLHVSVKSLFATCLMFEKIFDKGFDGFNLFVFIENNSIQFGCTSFESNSSKNNCILSNPIYKSNKIEELSGEFFYAATMQKFIDYYIYLQQLFLEDKPEIINSTMPWRQAENIYKYINALTTLSSLYKFGLFSGIDKLFEQLEIRSGSFNKLTLSEKIEEADEELSFVKSSRINPLEELFNAEEIERVNKEVFDKQQDNNYNSKSNYDYSETNDDEIPDNIGDATEVLKYIKLKQKEKNDFDKGPIHIKGKNVGEY